LGKLKSRGSKEGRGGGEGEEDEGGGGGEINMKRN
jgi:hypothetical protein